MAIERGIQFPLYDDPSDGTGGGTPNPADAGKTPNPADANTGKSPAPGAGATKPVEDPRVAGLIAEIQKERKARQEHESKYAATQGQLDAAQKRIQALAGLNPPSDEDAQKELVRNQFKKFFPHLADLTDEDVKALRESRQSLTSLQQAETQRFQRHTFDMVGRVEKSIAEQMGGDKKLTDRQQRTLRAAYANLVDSDPDAYEKHTNGDETFVDTFAKDFIEDWLEPMKRKAAADAQSRFRPVPNGKDRSISSTPAKKIDYNDPKAVEDALVEGFISRGGQFSGRR